jgi:hypothetical protein
MTNLVLRYAREPTRLDLLRTGVALVGRLATASGRPVGDAPISLWACDGGSARTISNRRLEGLVPSGAAKALVAVRVNTESDGVAAGKIALGPALYREAGGPAVERDPLEADNATRPLPIALGQPVSRGGPPFAVTAGRPFVLEVPMGATAGLEDAGYVALIFLGVDGREMKRLEIPLTPSRRTLGQTRTDARGRFRFATVPARSEGLIVGADYTGDDQLRGGAATTN